MEKTEQERLLDVIGESLMEDSEYPSEPTLLYAQLDHGMIGQSIYKDLGNQILFRCPIKDRLCEALLELWESQEGHERWSELEYVLRDGRFDVAYFYPDEIDPDEDVLERRSSTHPCSRTTNFRIMACRLHPVRRLARD